MTEYGDWFRKKEPFLVPNHWVSDYTFLQDEIFLSACDLSRNVRPIANSSRWVMGR